MAHYKGRYWLVFNRESSKQPLICRMSRQFDITFNIRQASINEETGILALELEGEHDTVLKAISWLESESVQVDPVELQTIEG